MSSLARSCQAVQKLMAKISASNNCWICMLIWRCRRNMTEIGLKIESAPKWPRWGNLSAAPFGSLTELVRSRLCDGGSGIPWAGNQLKLRRSRLNKFFQTLGGGFFLAGAARGETPDIRPALKHAGGQHLPGHAPVALPMIGGELIVRHEPKDVHAFEGFLFALDRNFARDGKPPDGQIIGLGKLHGDGSGHGFGIINQPPLPGQAKFRLVKTREIRTHQNGVYLDGITVRR